MKRRFRLRKSADFKRVRRLGKSYAHPLIVLVVLPNTEPTSRYAVSAGRSVGKAVQRNRAKRMIRAVLQRLAPKVQTGWDVILIARKPITTTNYHELFDTISKLLLKASLLVEEHVN